MTLGRLIQINISPGGVPKTPLTQAHVERLGIQGDSHRFVLHGGPDKALLIIASEVVDALRAEGWPVFYGALGENLTTGGLDHRAWRKGRQFRCGEVIFELTAPRRPCRKLNVYGRGIQKRILQESGESGFYAAVRQGGVLLPGDIIEEVERIS